MSNLKDLDIELDDENIKHNCEKELFDLIFCMNKKYVCYENMRILDICLEKKNLINHIKSNNVESQ